MAIQLLEDGDGAPLPASLQQVTPLWLAVYGALYAEATDKPTHVELTVRTNAIMVALAPIMFPNGAA